MLNIDKTWTELKSLLVSKHLNLQYTETTKKYCLFAIDDNIKYECVLYKDTSNVIGLDINQNNTDKTDFETNYKSSANQSIIPKDIDGKQFIRAESRPIGKTTFFTCTGDKIDSPQEIGEGKELKWDFSDTLTDDITPSGVNYKLKRIEFAFIDAINIKEGAIYWENKIFGSTIDIYVVCPTGAYYLDNSGNVQLATQDTIINHFVNKHFMMGTNYKGDELNTEASSTEIPSYYKYWLDIKVPNTDSTSKGYVSLEIYRPRTVIL